MYQLLVLVYKEILLYYVMTNIRHYVLIFYVLCSNEPYM